jgi:branched-chain amino acid transport system substrate-binding protein
MTNTLRIAAISFFVGVLISSCGGILPTKESAKPVLATLQSPAEITLIAKTPTPASRIDNKPVFRIGLLVPITGPLAFLGEGYQRGVELAMRELNYVVDGYRIEIILADTTGTPEGTILAAEQLIKEANINLMIGPGTSIEALAVLNTITVGKTPLIDGTSTSPLLFEKMGENGSQWYFRINADEKILARAFAKEIAKDKKSIALIAEDSLFTKEIASEYIKQFKSAGLTITLEEYLPVTEIEYRPVLFRTRQSRPDALFLVMSEGTCAIVMRQYKNSYTTIPVYSRGACVTGLFNQIIQDDTSIGAGIKEAVIFSELQDRKLAANFRDEFAMELTGHRMAGYYAARYVAVPALKAVIEADLPVNPENMRNAISNVRQDTPMGELRFDENNQAYLDAVILTNEEGKPGILEKLPLK